MAFDGRHPPQQFFSVHRRIRFPQPVASSDKQGTVLPDDLPDHPVGHQVALPRKHYDFSREDLNCTLAANREDVAGP
jgi:hypothetical protein